MSFTGDTKVLLASGAAIAISQLKPGDKVLATNTKTGRTQAEPVSAVLLHHDTDLYDLTVKTAHGTAVIDTTSSHLFWDPRKRQWVKAASLRAGEPLKTPGGATAYADGGTVPADHDGWMWDLTVPGGNDRDFYVDAAATAVLVHNCPNLSYSSKILRQMGPRGWTKATIQDAVDNPVATHYVWDFTTGSAQPATAYVSSNGGYVVVNDSTGDVVQVSDVNDATWKPVWNEARFQR